MFRSAKGQQLVTGTQMGDTVLVLGAGASRHLGYPLGGDLVEAIRRNTASERQASFRQLCEMGFSQRGIQEFHVQLVASNPSSIDDFLSRADADVGLGRAAIAQALIKCEHPDKLFSAKNNWYWQLAYYVRESLIINQHPPAIVTFNYDRSVDKFIHDVIRNWRPNQFACYRKIFKILHVHGRLGYLDTDGVEDYVRPYGGSGVTPEHILRSSEGIRVMPELEDDYGFEMLCSRQIIARAQKVLFVGFGYHQQNLLRLGLETENRDESFKGSGCFFGTSVGMKTGQVEEVRRRSGDRLALIRGTSQISRLLQSGLNQSFEDMAQVK
jgi:hypothetical protein